jgi:putative peptidoglycan lipid II flippase
MMFRFVNSESKTIFGAAAIVGVLSFASRLVGLVRDRVLAGRFWGTDVLDAYYAAFKVPDVMFNLIVIGSLSASFIPLFLKHFGNPLGKDKAWRLTNNVLHMIMVAMVVLAILLFLFAEPLASLIAPGFTAVKHDQVVEYTRIMLLSEIILGASVVFGSVLQGTKRFLLYSTAPALYNVGIIVGALWFVDWMGPAGLAWGVVFGALMHLCVQIAGVLETGYRYRFVFEPRDRDTVEMFRLMGPRVLGIAVSQLTFVMFTVIASTLAAGSLTVLQFAYNIEFFPIGIIGVAYAIAAFPTFSEAIEHHHTKDFVSAFSSTVRQVLFFLIPLMLVFLLLRAQIVRVVVGSGSFDWEATILTADTLAFFALTFVPQALTYILARAFFALHDTATPLVAGLVSALLSLITALWLTPHFGVTALGMAFSIGAIINVVLLWVPLRQRVGTLDEERILKSLFIMSSAGLLCGVVIQVTKPIVVNFLSLNTFFGVLFNGLICGGAGLLVYGIVAYALGSQEIRDVIQGVRKRVFRKVQPEEPIATETTTQS